jgi:hypothetical protein
VSLGRPNRQLVESDDSRPSFHPASQVVPGSESTGEIAVQAAAKKSSRKMRFSGIPFARSKVETDSHISG